MGTKSNTAKGVCRGGVTWRTQGEGDGRCRYPAHQSGMDGALLQVGPAPHFRPPRYAWPEGPRQPCFADVLPDAGLLFAGVIQNDIEADDIAAVYRSA